MLLEEFRECRNRDIEGVGAIVLFQSLQLCGIVDALGLLEGIDKRLRLGVNGIVEGGEGLLLRMVQEAALLKEEREIGLSINLEADQSSVVRIRGGMLCARDPPSLGQARRCQLCRRSPQEGP